jgi:hypothetical protein
VKTAEELNDILRRLYDDRDEPDDAISPAELSIAAFAEIDPEDTSTELVQAAAMLALRQLARAICRGRSETKRLSSESGKLFDYDLQSRYPVDRNGEQVYVKRMKLTLVERRANVTRLLNEGKSKTSHGNALRIETEDLLRCGVLVEEVTA